MQLRRLPSLAALFDVIKEQNALGAITRQEAVSMVPPLFLDVQPHHRVGVCGLIHTDTLQPI